MSYQAQQQMRPRSDSTDTIAMIIEIVFGLFGILGVGWLYVGNFLVGGMLFIGWFLALGAVVLLLTVFSAVTLGLGSVIACCIPPVGIAIAFISGLRVRDHVRNTGARGNILFLIIPALIGCGVISFIAITIYGALGAVVGQDFQNLLPTVPAP